MREQPEAFADCMRRVIAEGFQKLPPLIDLPKKYDMFRCVIFLMLEDGSEKRSWMINWRAE
jgi:hypothetical protein